MAFYGLGGRGNRNPFGGDPIGYGIGRKNKKDIIGALDTEKIPNASHYSSFRPPVASPGKIGGSSAGIKGYIGGGYDGLTGESSYDRYLAQLEQERLNRIAKIKEAIQAQVEQAVRGYESQIPGIKANYQNLKNQSEVERFNQARMLRESQANRGALDSGAGRQENLAMQNNYGNALNNINMAEQRDLNELNRAIADIRSQGAMQMALAEADASGDFSTALNVGYQNYGDSTNFANAAHGIRRATRGGSSVTSSTGSGLLGNESAIANELMDNKAKARLNLEILKRRLNRDDIKNLRRR